MVRQQLIIWQKCFPNFKLNSNKRFNLIRFSDRCEKWREEIVESTEQNCHQSIAWLASLTAHGNTCTLDALKVKKKQISLNHR